MTKAALSLLQLDLAQAVRFNPLLVVLPPLYMAYVIANKKQKRLLSRTIMAVMLTATVAFGLLRNMPAFVWLAPTAVF